MGILRELIIFSVKLVFRATVKCALLYNTRNDSGFNGIDPFKREFIDFTYVLIFSIALNYI